MATRWRVCKRVSRRERKVKALRLLYGFGAVLFVIEVLLIAIMRGN